VPDSSASASAFARPRDDARALALIQRHGRTATAFRALGQGLEHWFLADERGERGLVAYHRMRGAMVSAGEPVAAPHDVIPVAEAFVAFAATQRCRVSFFATEGSLGVAAIRAHVVGRATGMGSAVVGRRCVSPPIAS